MKHFFLLLFLSTSLLTATEPSFDESARTWVATYCISAKDADLLAVADLLYYSLKRSECTIETQQATTAALQELSHYSLAIVQTRLNPSKNSSYVFDKKQYKNNHMLVTQSLEQYFANNKLYDTTVQNIVHGDIIQSALVKKGITELRENARSAVAHALNEHIYSLQKSLKEAQKMMSAVAALFKKQMLPKMPTRSFLEYVWACVPQFLINSFVAFDTAYKNTHEQFCNALVKETEVGNAIWLAIESARASWYRAHYAALNTLLLERHLTHVTS